MSGIEDARAEREAQEQRRSAEQEREWQRDNYPSPFD